MIPIRFITKKQFVSDFKHKLRGWNDWRDVIEGVI